MANHCVSCKKYVKTHLSDDGWIIATGLYGTGGSGIVLDVKAVLFLKCVDCGEEVGVKRFIHTFGAPRPCVHGGSLLVLDEVTLEPQEELVSRAGQFPLKSYNALLTAHAHCSKCDRSVKFKDTVRLSAGSFNPATEVPT